MVVHMRHTRGHTGNRRSHHALKEVRVSVCKECGQEYIRHRVCMGCGMYRGKQVVDVKGKTERKERRVQEKRRARGEATKSE